MNIKHEEKGEQEMPNYCENFLSIEGNADTLKEIMDFVKSDKSVFDFEKIVPITAMSTIEITSKIEALKELEALIEEAKAEAEALRDEIKTEMLNRNTEEMEAGQYIVRWTSVLSQRFDSTAFKKVMPDIYKSFTKQVSSRRFSIA